MSLPDLDRFADPGILILASLADGPKHGYAMMDDIEAFSGSRPGPGTLYGALARLERDGMIEPLAAEDRRRPYRLTPAGADALRRHLESLAAFSALGLRRLAPA